MIGLPSFGMKIAAKQFLRYATVGLASNLLGYLLYLGLTHIGIGPKTSMSLLYGVGVAQTFIFNKRWTFHHAGSNRPAIIRYGVAYGLGYVVNFICLLFFVDKMGWAHQVVQGVLIVTIAVMLFLLQKFWVFQREDAILKV